MSELVLQESSDPDNSSSDDELNLIKKEASNNYNFTKMIKSKDKVDKRLLDHFLIKQAHRMGVPIDLNVCDNEDEFDIKKEEHIGEKELVKK